MKSFLLPSSFAVICACVPVQMTQPSNVLIDMGQIETANDGRCYANDISPAVIETVIIQEIENPEVRDANGQVTRPAAFRTVNRQQIVRERVGIRFETVCPQNYTIERVSTLQRALKARGFYNGPISGTLDRATGFAIQQFQRTDGPDTVLLSIATARKLGVVAFDRATLDAG